MSCSTRPSRNQVTRQPHSMSFKEPLPALVKRMDTKDMLDPIKAHALTKIVGNGLC